MHRVNVQNWAEFGEVFTRFFENAGRVSCSPQRAHFVAVSDDGLHTEFAMDRSGTLAAGMPLHGLQVQVSWVTFDFDERQVLCEGPGVSYIYRVPRVLISA